MAHPNEDLIRRGYDAFGTEGYENHVQSDWADDIVLHVGGTSQISGDFRGRDEILNALANIAKLTDGNLTNEVHDILANDTHAVVLVRQQAQREGRSLDNLGVHVWHIADGKLTEAWGVSTDQAAMDAFFA
jgi:uncharacterized protein